MPPPKSPSPKHNQSVTLEAENIDLQQPQFYPHCPTQTSKDSWTSLLLKPTATFVFMSFDPYSSFDTADH